MGVDDVNKLIAAAVTNGTSRRAVLVLVAVNLVAVVVLAVVVWARVTEDTFDPLGSYPLQDVLNEGDPPVIALNEFVIVEGTKCNDTEHPVPIEGEMSWRNLDPRGSTFVTGVTPGTRLPGCVTTVFQNPIPAEVKDRTLRLIEGGFDPVWELGGIETPIRDDGFKGTSRRWMTEPFRLIP